MYLSCTDKEAYIAAMDRLKKENLNTMSGSSRHPGYQKLFHFIQTGQLGAAWKLLKNKFLRVIGPGKKKRLSLLFAEISSILIKTKTPKLKTPAPNYFSDEAIAVYTVVFGHYDHLYEPLCRPDNCRFFLISDTLCPPKGSAWERLALPEELQSRLNGMNHTEKNRFLKMLPHLLFPDFRYSVYLDGNIQMVSDPTEFINHMPACGFSAHRHVSRNCVYEEAKAIVLQKRAPEEAMEELVTYLKQQNMPASYGLIECPVLVRRHHQPECVKLMEEWWALFERFPYRDQMLLPLVLYRNGIQTKDVDWIGPNVRHSPSFRRYEHPVKNNPLLGVPQ